MQYPNVPHPININIMHNNYSTGFFGKISPYPTNFNIIKIISFLIKN